MNPEKLFIVLREPCATEKATIMAEKFKQFTFKVLNTATKYEIKEAVEKLFKVKVQNVNVMNVKGKQKRFRQMPGKRSDWKKAYVTLEPGFDIDFSLSE